MDKRDKLWLRILMIVFGLFIILLAYVAWMLGHTVQDQTNHTKAIVEVEKRRNDLQQKQIDTLSTKLEQLYKNYPKNGEDGKNGESIKGDTGEKGKDGVTRVETHNTQTVVEKPVPTTPPEPLAGRDGRTPQLAIDADTKRWITRYEGDEEWQPVPILCKALTINCTDEP